MVIADELEEMVFEHGLQAEAQFRIQGLALVERARQAGTCCKNGVAT